VVIAIIGILAAVVLASLSQSRELAEIRKAQADMRNIHTAMEQLFNDTGLYPHQLTSYCPSQFRPGNEVDLSLSSSGLLGNDGSFENWSGPYVTDVLDPWGNPYFLDEDYYCLSSTVGCNGKQDTAPDSSVLVSCGPNNARGVSPEAPGFSNGTACAYDSDNVVYYFCGL
jgi:type II secretory pathway pseudopilin PulG